MTRRTFFGAIAALLGLVTVRKAKTTRVDLPLASTSGDVLYVWDGTTWRRWHNLPTATGTYDLDNSEADVFVIDGFHEGGVSGHWERDGRHLDGAFLPILDQT